MDIKDNNNSKTLINEGDKAFCEKFSEFSPETFGASFSSPLVKFARGGVVRVTQPEEVSPEHKN